MKTWMKVTLATVCIIAVVLFGTYVYFTKYTYVAGISDFKIRVLLTRADNARSAKKYDVAIARFDAVVERYQNDTDPHIRALAAHALMEKGWTLFLSNQREEEIQAYDLYLERFQNDTEPEAKYWVDSAFYRKAHALLVLAKTNEAIVALDACITHFQDDPEPSILSVTRVFWQKGKTLERLGRTEEAIAVYDACITQYGNDENRLSNGYMREVIEARDALLNEEQ